MQIRVNPIGPVICEVGEDLEFVLILFKRFFCQFSVCDVPDAALDDRYMVDGIDIAYKLDILNLPILCFKREVFVPDIFPFLQFIKGNL